MIPELGLLALILGFCAAMVLSVMPLIGSFTASQSWMAIARPAASGQLFFVSLAYACLTWSFVQSDFSVAYVANNSNTALPLMYKIAGVWGGHSGSILLWILILSGWTAAVAVISRRLPTVLLSRVLSVLGMISIGFTLVCATHIQPV